MLDLYTDSSPKGFKITIALEELGIPWRLHHIRIDQGEHRSPAFLKLNPHGRIPVLVDDDTVLFESSAILLYLAEKTGQLLANRWEAIKWLQFHSASMGPILGQRVHFEMFAAVPIPAAITRYRLLGEEAFATLDLRLRDNAFLAGEAFSIADIATFGWTHIAEICGFDFSQYTHLTRWHGQIAARPPVQRGISLPEPATGP